MSCCGNGRAGLRRQSVVSPSMQTREWVSGPVDFEYTGSGELSVTGPFTGVLYRFTGYGSRVRVQGADASSLISVPGLRQAD